MELVGEVENVNWMLDTPRDGKGGKGGKGSRKGNYRRGSWGSKGKGGKGGKGGSWVRPQAIEEDMKEESEDSRLRRELLSGMAKPSTDTKSSPAKGTKAGSAGEANAQDSKAEEKRKLLEKIEALQKNKVAKQAAPAPAAKLNPKAAAFQPSSATLGGAGKPDAAATTKSDEYSSEKDALKAMIEEQEAQRRAQMREAERIAEKAALKRMIEEREEQLKEAKKHKTEGQEKADTEAPT